MYSVEKTAKFNPNATSHKPHRITKKREPPSQISPQRDKSFEKLKKTIENGNEQNSFLSKDTNSKRKIMAIVTLNIEDECEKLIIYEGQDIYELAANITKKYQLSKDFTNYITDNINKQIIEHNNAKKKGINHNINNNQILSRGDESLTPKFKRGNNFHFENLNNSKSIERVPKSPRQRTASPLKKEVNIPKNQKNFEDSSYAVANSKYGKFEQSQYLNKKITQHEIDGNKFASTSSRSKKKDNNLLDNSKFINAGGQCEESLSESIRKIKNSVAKEKKFGFSPSNRNNKYKQPTVLVSKDLKIIENNIIFLPSNFLTSKDNERKKEKSTGKTKKRTFFSFFHAFKNKFFTENFIKNNKCENTTPKKFEKVKTDLNYSDKFLVDLQDIFFTLDDDEDGYISSKNIDLMRVDPRILSIIQNILIEMDEKQEILNFAGFMNKIEQHRLEVKIHDVINI
jgi:hypothetical protein